MTARAPLSVASVREPSPRARRHRAMAAVVAAYLAAAVVVVAAQAGDRRWLALHLVGLGAATNAVMVWSRHFAQAVLHARLRTERIAYLQLVVLNVGIVGVLVGVASDTQAVAGGAAAVVAVAVAWHVGALVAMARVHRLPGPLRVVAGFYVLSGTSLVVGAVLGGLMAGGAVADGSVAQRRLHLAHAQLNLLGWIGLAVLGSLVVLWPAVARTRMPDRAPSIARWTLLMCGGGTALLGLGSGIGSRGLAVAGCAVYVAGVALSADTIRRTAPGRTADLAAASALVTGQCWLMAGLVVDAWRIVQETGPDAVLRPLVPLLVVGFVVQTLIGALTFLLPVTIGGGPHGNRRLAATLHRWWPGRTIIGNVGLLLVVAPGSSAMHVAGWVGVLVGFAAFLPLLAVALLGRSRPVHAARGQLSGD